MKFKALHPYFLLATLVLSTLIASAQTPNPLFRHLPPDANKVYHINLPALTSKVAWEDMIGSLPLPSKGNDDMMAIVKDPSMAGVDIHQDVLMAEAGNDPYDSATYAIIIVHLTDSAKFIAAVRGKEKGLHTYHLPGKGQAAGKDKLGLAWDDKLAVITIITPSGKELEAASKSKSSAPSQTTVKPAFSAAHTLAAAKRSAAALQGYTSNIYTTDPEFLAGFSDDADFHMWAPQGAGIATLFKQVNKKDPAMAKELEKKARLSKLHVLTALRFDAGKLSVRSTTLLPPDSLAIYKKFNTVPLNPDLMARIPGKDLLAVVNIHFDPSIVGYIMDKAKLRSKVDSSLSKKGLVIDDFEKAFKGDFLIAATTPPADSAGNIAKSPAIYFVTTIRDMASFMKIGAALKLTKDPSDTSTGTDMLSKMKTAFTIKDNILVVSSKKGLTDGYFSNTSRRNLDFVTPRVQNSPFSMIIDIKAVGAFLQQAAPESQKTQQMLHFINALDRLTIAAGALVDGNKSEIYFELKMADASENSLKSLFKLLH